MDDRFIFTVVVSAGLAIGCPPSGAESTDPSGGATKAGGSASRSAAAPGSSGSVHDEHHEHDHDEGVSAGGAKLDIGDPAPETEREMKSVDSSMASVRSAAKNEGVLVIFTCNHCPWVKAWQERTVALANSFLERGVGVIAINSNDPAANAEDSFEGMQDRANAQGMQYPYVVDQGSVMARAYGATKTPEFFLFDGDFELVYHGAIDDNAQAPERVRRKYLNDALEALVSGEPIAIRETKALGCGIKFQDAS